MRPPEQKRDLHRHPPPVLQLQDLEVRRLGGRLRARHLLRRRMRRRQCLHHQRQVRSQERQPAVQRPLGRLLQLCRRLRHRQELLRQGELRVRELHGAVESVAGAGERELDVGYWDDA